jgi:hypothetical protein
MSVSMRNYVLYGTSLSYKIVKQAYGEEAHEKFASLMPNHPSGTVPPGLMCLFDGMNGEHVVLGRVRAISEMDGSFSDNGSDVLNITARTWRKSDVEKDIRKFLHQIDAPQMLWPLAEDFKWLLVTHWR